MSEPEQTPSASKKENEGGKLLLNPSTLNCDYIISYEENLEYPPPQEYQEACEKIRKVFEEEIVAAGIDMTRETVSTPVRNVHYLLLTAKPETLEREAENYALNLNLKDQKDMTTRSEGLYLRLTKRFQSDDEEDYVAAPFEVAYRNLFAGADDGTLFRTAHRQLLVFEVISRLNISASVEDLKSIGKNKVGLPYLLLKKIYSEALFVHDPIDHENSSDARSVIAQSWGKINKFQPLWKLRNYFGEKMTLYFAWLGYLTFSLLFPALFGLAVFFYGIWVKYDKDASGFSATMGALFDNNATPVFSLCLCLWGSVFLETWKRKEASLAYQWDVREFEEEERERPSFIGTRERINPVTGMLEKYFPFAKKLRKMISSYVFVIFMIFLVLTSAVAVITFRVAATTWSGVGAGFVSILPSILNAVSIQVFGFLYNKLAFILTEWENHRTQTAFNDHLIIKIFAFQFVNSYTALFYIAFFRNGLKLWGHDKWTDECGVENDCMSMLSMQVLVMMLAKPVPKMLKENLIPWVKIYFRRRKNRVSVEGGPWYQEEAVLEPSETLLKDFTVEEYADKVIQYGYLTIFATAFPLAPLFVVLTNFLDMRFDGRRLLFSMRRPCPQRAEDIGMWYSILEFVNAIAVVSNGFLLAFTSQYGKNFEDDHGHLSNLWIVIGFEHIVFTVKFLIAYLIPDVPEEIVLAERKRLLVVNRLFHKKFPLEDSSVEVNMDSPL